jgi:hypothetical protein
MNDLIGGQVDVFFEATANVVQHATEGRIVPLMATRAARIASEGAVAPGVSPRGAKTGCLGEHGGMPGATETKRARVETVGNAG